MYILFHPSIQDNCLYMLHKHCLSLLLLIRNILLDIKSHTCFSKSILSDMMYNFMLKINKSCMGTYIVYSI